MPPLDRAALDRLALAYVARYATTRAKLIAYLQRKITEHGWAAEDDGGDGGDAPPIAVIADRCVALGYVDDRAFAAARAAALTRRGYGVRRVELALRGAGVDRVERDAALDAVEPDAAQAALSFARRRRLGPFAPDPADPVARRRAYAALVRAGHDPALCRSILDHVSGPEAFDEPDDE